MNVKESPYNCQFPQSERYTYIFYMNITLNDKCLLSFNKSKKSILYTVQGEVRNLKVKELLTQVNKFVMFSVFSLL